MSGLSLASVSAAYGDVQALYDVSFSVSESEVVALMGRNGMGKTTTVKTICSLLPLSSGSLMFNGVNLAKLPAHQVARLGLGLVPEGRRCFSNLTVRENLLVAAQPGYWDLTQVGRLFPRLKERMPQFASTLSGGEQQMLAIGRALLTNPKLLILDEATEGLAPRIRQEIWIAIKDLKMQTGLGILVIDKSLKELGNIADRAIILEKGVSVWSGQLGDLTPEEIHRYLGV